MKTSTLRNLRRWHHYVGVLLAPSILFFAFTGFIQVVGWQDQRDPPPPAWVSWASGIHKKQQAPRPRPPAAVKPAPRSEDKEAFVPLKVVALLTAIGLFGSTLIGLVIALTNAALRRRSWLLLAFGVVVPVLLIVL